MRSTSIFALTLFLAFFTTSLVVAQGHQSLEEQGYIAKVAPEMEHVCLFELSHQNQFFYQKADWSSLKLPGKRQAIDFDVQYTSDDGEWPQEAVNAFEYALDIWSAHISSAIPVRILANWTELGGNTLGSAGPTLIFQIPEGKPDTWYPVAQASAISGRDLVSQSSNTFYDISVNINSAFSSWYFGTDANTPVGKIDFVTVALHEIGHGLGFLGSMSGDETQEIAAWGFDDPPSPIVYDRFIVDGEAEDIINESRYPNPSQELYRAVTGQFNGIFFTGEETTSQFQDLPVPLYSPDPWRQGSSYSHLDQDIFTNTENALMRPQIGFAYAMHSPGPITCGIFSDTGWPLSGGCLSLLGAQSLLTFNESDINFGVTNAGTAIQEAISISANSDSPNSLVGRVTIAGDSDAFSIPGGVILLNIEPGEELNIPVSFNGSRKGEFSAVLNIEHNGSNLPSPLTVALSGESLEENVLVELEQNYPNPFNASTNISYALPKNSNVRLDVYNQLGKLVQTLVNETQPRGRYVEQLRADRLSSGMYFYRIVVDGASKTGKMMFLK